MTEPDYGQLQAFATAYRQSALLFAAIELGVFGHVDSGCCTVEELAKALSLELVPASLLLNGLAALGILEHDDGAYRSVPSFRVLAPGADYFGDQLLLHKQQNQNWLRMAEIMRGAHDGPSFESQLMQSDRVPSYLDSIEKANQSYADRVLTFLSPTIAGAERVLDIGGGHGYYARRIVTDTTNTSVTILDLARAVDYARQRLGDLLPGGRVELVVGDARTHTERDAYDIVMVNDLLHYFDRVDQQHILMRAALALRDGGMLVVSKFRLSADGTTPASAALFSLKMYMNTLSGYLPTDEEVADHLGSLALRSVRLLNFAPDKTVVVGHR